MTKERKSVISHKEAFQNTVDFSVGAAYDMIAQEVRDRKDNLLDIAYDDVRDCMVARLGKKLGNAYMEIFEEEIREYIVNTVEAEINDL